MGNDGGSIPDRRDLVRSKPKAEQADRANQTRAKWFFCALSKKPLAEPIVSDALGKLYNKDAILEFLLDRGSYGDGENICGHIRSLKDVKTLSLTPITTPNAEASNTDGQPKFLCPLTRKEMTGHVPFVYLTPCGCVLSQAGFKALSSAPSPTAKDDEPTSTQLDVCPQCAKKFDRNTDVRMINPPAEEEEKMRAAMLMAKPKGKKRKAAAAQADAAEPAAKVQKASPPTSVNPNVPATSRALQSSLALEEAKRKAGMSDAVKSLYRDKNSARKETFMTMGTFTRYA